MAYGSIPGSVLKIISYQRVADVIDLLPSFPVDEVEHGR